MMQATEQKSKSNIILILVIALLILLAGLGYFVFLKPKPPLIYTVNIGLEQFYKLRPRPIRHRPNPKIAFYLTGDVVEVSKYERIELINSTGTGLRILEELEEKGLILLVEPQPRNSDKKLNITLNEPDILKEVTTKESGSQIYTVEVDKLKKEKKYIICENIPWENHPMRYFLAFTKNPSSQDQ